MTHGKPSTPRTHRAEMSLLARLWYEVLRRVVPPNRVHAVITTIRGGHQSLGRRTVTIVGRWFARRLAAWILRVAVSFAVSTWVVPVVHERLVSLILWVMATVLS